MRACDDFRTTESARRGLANRPVSRRSLLQAGLGATLSVYAAKASPLSHQLEAATASAATNPSAPVLVNVFLPGGLDLLDTLVPVGQYGRYADLRSTVKVDAPLDLGGGFGAHPSLAEGLNGGLKGLYDRGQLGFLPGIDYADPDLSHFNSRHFWETGIVTLKAAPGWMARWIDRHGDRDNPFQGISMDAGLSPLLRGARAPVAAVQSPDDAQMWIPGVWGDWHDRYLEHYGAIGAKRPKAAGPAAVYGAARQSRYVAQVLRPYVRQDDVDPLAPPVAYPGAADGRGTNGFAENLRYLAAMLSLPLGIRVATVEGQGDFDTHDDQKQGLSQDLGRVSAALSAFQADLDARGLSGRVLTFVWTEFGRRPEENSSGGTDHGAGGIAWVMGPRARGGILTPYPDLTSFDDHDNLRVTVDFRTVYASLLEQWMGTGADEILPVAAGGRIALVA